MRTNELFLDYDNIKHQKRTKEKKVMNRIIRKLCKQKYRRVLYNINILRINIHYGFEPATEKRLVYSMDCGDSLIFVNDYYL